MEIAILVVALIILVEVTMFFLKYKPAISNNRHNRIYVDTSVLIDGRIINIARCGFLTGDLVILKSVLLEMQLLADGKDSIKRARARAGLEAAAELERIDNVNVIILDDSDHTKKVDEELLRLAKENRGVLLTIDYNLIKVAKAERIKTLNINELALALRNEFLPGEKIKIKILEKGSNRGQGVGHLDDGTMVVVESAANKIGKEIIVEFVKFYETPAGKMIFARPAKKK